MYREGWQGQRGIVRAAWALYAGQEGNKILCRRSEGRWRVHNETRKVAGAYMLL